MSEKIFQPKQIKKTEVDLERVAQYEQVKRGLSSHFVSYETGTERIEAFKTGIAGVLKYLENSDDIIEALEKCEHIEDRKKFVEAVFEAVKPVIDFKITSPEAFLSDGEDARAFIEINELLSYELRDDFIFIHLLPEERVGKGLTKFKEGLSILAEIVDKHQEIETIRAESSWIIKRHPAIIEKFGFTIDGKENAHMERAYFLKRYLSREIK